MKDKDNPLIQPTATADELKAKRKATAIKYLMAAKASQPKWSQADQIRFAIVRFILDELGEKEQETRKDVAMAFLAMPAWFGASANAMQECPDYVKRVEAATREFADV